jgi:putative transposase
VHGELLVLGVKVAVSTVREILREAGIDPAPERACGTWADFLRSQADALLACDLVTAAGGSSCLDLPEQRSLRSVA